MTTKLLIFGITGDLSRRKLLPALKEITGTGDFDDLEIIGVSRRDVDVEGLLIGSVGDSQLASKVSVFKMDLAEANDYVRLKDYLNIQDDQQLVAYMSVPPAATTQIVDLMGEAGLNGPNVKLLFEKPFGMDLESARDVLARTANYYDEQQIYRIDHYLAKEMAQNIVAFRGGNALFHHIWNNQFIESIEIVASEKIGIEGRAQFYEQTGALRDVLQGHLMQLLALVLMEVPDHLNWAQLPAKRLEALNNLQVANRAKAIRAQYEGYQEEVENPGSQTETFVSVQLESDDPRWVGVPLRLTTGKALNEKTTEIRINLKKYHEAQSNCLKFRVQPNEGIEIDLFAKKPGYSRQFTTESLSFNYPADAKLPDAYEQVIVDAISGHKNLFTESDEVLRSWEVLQPIMNFWSMNEAPMPKYPKNSPISSVIG